MIRFIGRVMIPRACLMKGEIVGASYRGNGGMNCLIRGCRLPEWLLAW